MKKPALWNNPPSPKCKTQSLVFSNNFLNSGPDGLKFPVHNIKVSKDGVRTSHESKNEMFHSLSKDDLEVKIYCFCCRNSFERLKDFLEEALLVRF